MKRTIYTLMIMFGLTMIAAPSYARHYDCSKAGNVNKVVCKHAAAAAHARSKAAKAKAKAKAAGHKVKTKVHKAMNRITH